MKISADINSFIYKVKEANKITEPAQRNGMLGETYDEIMEDKEIFYDQASHLFGSRTSKSIYEISFDIGDAYYKYESRPLDTISTPIAHEFIHYYFDMEYFLPFIERLKTIGDVALDHIGVYYVNNVYWGRSWDHSNQKDETSIQKVRVTGNLRMNLKNYIFIEYNISHQYLGEPFEMKGNRTQDRQLLIRDILFS